MERWTILVENNTGARVAKVKTNLKNCTTGAVIEDCDFAINCRISDEEWETGKHSCTLATAYLIDGEKAVFRLNYPDY